MAEDEKISSKEIMKDIKSTVVNTSSKGKIDQEKFDIVKSEITEILPSLMIEYENEIPYSAIHERTQIAYELIQVIIMDLLMKKDILGFVNDRSTSELSDDILMIREKRILDSIEPDYRTG